MDWLEKFSNAVQKLYQGFLLRDVFGYMLPGALVLGFMLIRNEDLVSSIINKPLVQDFLALSYIKPVIVVAAVASAYLTGISIWGLGIFLGLLRYYPPGMRRLAFHCEGVQFNCDERVKKSSQERGRVVIILHAAGNFGCAVLLCGLLSFTTGIVWFWVVVLVGALLRHWESVYNLRSYQEAVLDTHKITIHDQPAKEGLFGEFFENGGLVGLLFTVCRWLRLKVFSRKRQGQGPGKGDDKPA
jgi:hypothetical protein